MHVLRPTARMKIRRINAIFPESFEINLCKSRLAILFSRRWDSTTDMK